MLYSVADRSCWFDERRSKMKELVRLRMRPSRNGKTFRYVLDYVDASGKKRCKSLGHADKRKAEKQRKETELELRMGVLGPGPMTLTVTSCFHALRRIANSAWVRAALATL